VLAVVPVEALARAQVVVARAVLLRAVVLQLRQHRRQWALAWQVARRWAVWPQALLPLVQQWL
jgi:hypothetical protein